MSAANNLGYTKKEMSITTAATFSSLLPLLDGSIVHVIMPGLATIFSVSKSQIQWVVTAYFLASIIGLLLSSPLQRRSGIRNVWMLSSMVFMLGSLATGLSYNFNSIVIARVI